MTAQGGDASRLGQELVPVHAERGDMMVCEHREREPVSCCAWRGAPMAMERISPFVTWDRAVEVAWQVLAGETADDAARDRAARGLAAYVLYIAAEPGGTGRMVRPLGGTAGGAP
jgi:hypothetical protein